jgi:hypothetical protein
MLVDARKISRDRNSDANTNPSMSAFHYKVPNLTNYADVQRYVQELKYTRSLQQIDEINNSNQHQ